MNVNFVFAIFALVIALVVIVIISNKNAPSAEQKNKKAGAAVDELKKTATVEVPARAEIDEEIVGSTNDAVREIKPATAKALLTANEQPMYFRLCEAFPSHVVLAQVSFGAMLHSRDQLVRNQFNRKIADFVLCTRAFEVVAILELDDSSHRGREEKDAARDRLLTDAGYRVLRYKVVPDAERLKKDVALAL